MKVFLIMLMLQSITWSSELSDSKIDDYDPYYYIPDDEDIFTVFTKITTDQGVTDANETYTSELLTTATSALSSLSSSPQSPSSLPSITTPEPATNQTAVHPPPIPPNMTYQHIAYFTTLSVLYQPSWGNPWRQKFRLSIDKVLQRNVSRRTLENIWRQTAFPVSQSASSAGNGSSNLSQSSALPADVNSHLVISPRTLFPFDHFWSVVVQWVVPLFSVVLLLFCLILEPLFSKCELCNCFLTKRIRSSAIFRKKQQQGKLSKSQDPSSSFDTLYRGLSTIQPEKSSLKSNDAAAQNALFSKGASNQQGVKSVSSWRSLDSWSAVASSSMAKKQKKVKDHFTFNSSAVFASSDGKADDPLRVKF